MILFGLLPGLCPAGFAQTQGDRHVQEAGIAFIRNFRPVEYGASSTNRHISQDHRGIMYFANEGGILEFDGVNWRIVSMPGQMAVRSLCEVNGRIYVGANSDFGYLTGGRSGATQFVSLKRHVPEAYRDFKGIWETLAIDDTVFFRSYDILFRWANGRISAWRSASLFHNAYVSGNQFFVREVNQGLKELRHDSLQMIPGGDRFDQQPVAAMLPIGDNKTLILSRFKGWFLYDGQKISDNFAAPDSFLATGLVIHAALLNEQKIAVATHRKGLGIFDLQGNLLQIIDKNAGLRDKAINFVYPDRDGGLWLALNDGLARVEVPSPFSKFSENNGLEGLVTRVLRHDGTIYVATTYGVFQLTNERDPSRKFMQLKGVSSTTYSLLPNAGQLLVGVNLGLFQLQNGILVPGKFRQSNPRINASITCMEPSYRHPRRSWLGTYQGLHQLDRDDSGSLYERRIGNFGKYVVGIAEDSVGGLWAGTRDGLYYLPSDKLDLLNTGDITKIEPRFYSTADGLPPKSVIPVRIDKHVCFATSAGLRRFDATNQRFLPDSSFGSILADTLLRIRSLAKGAGDDLWVCGRKGDQQVIGQIGLRPDGQSDWLRKPSLRFDTIGQIRSVYPDQDSVVWFGSAEGLVRYSLREQQSSPPAYSTLIRSVKSSGDSLIYQGMPTGVRGSNQRDQSHPQQLPFAANNLRFEFAAPSFGMHSNNVYRFLLHGYDNDWSPWQSETRKDYTGLPPGSYRFSVQARDNRGQVHKPDHYHFAIMAPWYRTWWAFIGYLLLVGGAIMVVFQWRMRQLRFRNLRLEALVEQRTATMREQAEKLAALDSMKSRFFANISHEFRTPLTLILGPLQDLMTRMQDKKMKSSLGLMQRNAQRLLRLINQLLDLSRLESGRLQLRAATGDFIGCLNGIVMSFATLAEQKNITLAIDHQIPDGLLSRLYFDRDKIEKVFINLVSNAFKFTPQGGAISVECRLASHETLEISVRDSGSGIAAGKLPFIFDRFYQAGDGESYQGEGTGIGLALARELVELHGGQIAVASEPGQGAEFIVTLPLGKEHLRDDQLVSANVADSMADEADSTLVTDESLLQEESTDLQDTLPAEEDRVILVVDDHRDMREYIRHHLCEDFFLVEAVNGTDGYNKATELLPDLILSDVMMPEMDGHQLCHALKTDEKTSHIPVILLTARAGEEDKVHGLETGADDYLTKPFNARELRTRVDNLITLRRQLRERFRREGLLLPRYTAVTSVEEVFIQKLMKIVEQHLEDENFSIEKLSGILHMSRRQLHRKIRALTNQSPTDFIRSTRLHRARQMLEKQAGTVSEIAYAVGFNNLSYFAKSFRAEFGVAPSDILNP